jgi:hypothetical protein
MPEYDAEVEVEPAQIVAGTMKKNKLNRFLKCRGTGEKVRDLRENETRRMINTLRKRREAAKLGRAARKRNREAASTRHRKMASRESQEVKMARRAKYAKKLAKTMG